MYKFYNDFLDNLIEFKPSSSINSIFEFKEINSLNYLIISRALLLVIPIIFKKNFLTIKQFKTKKEWQNYIDNEFKNWCLKNNINKIIVNLEDKPDLIIIQNDKKIGVELTSVFPFLKSRQGGDTFKYHESKQEEIKIDFEEKLKKLKLAEKIPKIKIIDGKVIFPESFLNLNDQKIIESAIAQVNNLNQISPIYFYPIYVKNSCNKAEIEEKLISSVCVIERIGENAKDKLSINNYESNLINTIQDKNKKLEKYYKLKVANNVLLILVEEISYFSSLVISARDGSSELNYSYKIKDECCINHYLEQVYSNTGKAENNFDETIIIYKDDSLIRHIYVLKKN